MKKQILFPMLAVLGLNAAQAQPLTSFSDDHAMAISTASPANNHVRRHSAPATETAGFMAREAFYRDFREATDAVWTPGKTMDRVDFMLQGKPLTAYYDLQADLIGTTSVRSPEELPERARKEIAKKYPGYKMGELIFFEDNTYNESDMILFDNRFDDADNYFLQLTDGPKEIILQVSPEGSVSVFREKK